MRRLGWSVLLGVAIALPSMNAGAADGFPDLGSHPLAGAAELLAERRILAGASDYEYGGALPLTRYDAAEILNGLLDPRDIPFNIIAWPDVPPGHPAMQAVTRVTSLNLLDGRNGGRFQGMQRVTRLEFVESLDRLLSYRSAPPPPRRTGGIVTFSDVPVSGNTGQMLHRAANVWQFLDNPRGLAFRPNAPLTRYEALAMLVKASPLLDPSLAEHLAERIEEEPEPTPEPTPAPMRTPTPTPDPVRTPAPLQTPAPFKTPLSTPKPTATPTPTEDADWPAWLPTPAATAKPIAASPTPAPVRSTAPGATPAPAGGDDWPDWLPRPGASSTPTAVASPTPAPAPAPTAKPSPQPKPTATPTPRPTPTPKPKRTPAPKPGRTPSPAPAPLETPSVTTSLLENRYRAGLNMYVAYVEGLPNSPDMVAPGESTELTGGIIFGPHASGQYWFGDWGGAGQLSLAGPIAVQTTSLLDLNLHGQGYYRLPWKGENWEAAAGAGALVRLVNGGGDTYQTTSKFSFGLGPAGTIAFRPAPKFLVTGDAQFYPLIFQTYSLAAGSAMGLRGGLGYQAGLEYELMPLGKGALNAGVYYQGFLGMLYDASGRQIQQALSAGLGGSF